MKINVQLTDEFMYLYIYIYIHTYMYILSIYTVTLLIYYPSIDTQPAYNLCAALMTSPKTPAAVTAAPAPAP